MRHTQPTLTLDHVIFFGYDVGVPRSLRTRHIHTYLDHVCICSPVIVQHNLNDVITKLVASLRKYSVE